MLKMETLVSVELLQYTEEALEVLVIVWKPFFTLSTGDKFKINASEQSCMHLTYSMSMGKELKMIDLEIH